MVSSNLVIAVRRPRANLVGDSRRGSSAFGGAADILFDMKRANSEGHPTRRMLQGVGRFGDAHPAELMLDLNDAGRYVAIGDSFDVERKEARVAVLDKAPGSREAAITVPQLQEQCGVPSSSTLRRVLADLVSEGLVRQEKGAGTASTRAYGFWCAVPPGDELSTEGLTPEKFVEHATPPGPTDELFSPPTHRGKLVERGLCAITGRLCLTCVIRCAADEFPPLVQAAIDRGGGWFWWRLSMRRGDSSCVDGIEPPRFQNERPWLS